MMKSYVLVIIAFLSLLQLQAQKPGARLITGKVVGGASKTALSAASVYVKGTRNAISSGVNGEFSIMAQTGDVLVISSIGYKTKEIKLGASTNTIDVELSQDYGNLQDVVVVGYGKMKKTDLSSAVATVSNAELNRTVNITMDEALQGKAANVYVSQTSGQPGAGASVIIRGVSTVTGNYQPLYVIDGVQIRPSAPTGGTYNQPTGYANELAGINTDDIEDYNILEGAAATSIYGAAGANGVIMITTKHGKAGLTKVNASTLFSWQDKPTFRPVMNLQEYARYIQKLQQLGLVGAEPPELADPSILGPGTNWQDALFRRTLLQKHSLAISGGSDKSTFYFSGDYLSQDGIALGSGFKRGSVRINLDNQATKWLKFGVNLSVFTTKEVVNVTNSNIINIAITQNPTIPLKNPDGSWGGPEPAEAQYSQTNPVALAMINNNYNTSFGAIGGVYLDITPIKGLLWHTETNGNYSTNNNYTFYPAYTIGALVNKTTNGSRASGNNYWASLNTRLQYDLKLNKHGITAMVGHEASKYEYESLYGQGLNYSTASIQELTVADPLSSPKATSSRGDGSNESYFGRLNYIFDNKYIAQVVVRRDGSSNFGESNRFGTFPAASVAWKISEENFMKDLHFINDLKLRAEYGISGNTGSSGGAIYSNLYAAATIWGGGFAPANFNNPFLKWEEDKSTNIGLDLHMFNNRVEVIADAYVKNITNLILLASGPIALGGNLSGGYGGLLSWPYQNYGGMQNKGFGITVNTVNISTKDFQWRTGVNFSVDKNKVTKLVSTLVTQYTSFTNNNQTQILTQVGQPLSMFTGYIAEGLFQNYQDIANHAVQTSNGVLTVDPTQGSWVGDIKFKDISGPNGKPDGIIDEKDRTIIGNPWPKFTYNFNSAFTYKNFELNLFFTGVYGNQILNLTRYQNEMPLGTGPYSNHYKVAANFAVPSSNNVADALTATLLNPGTKIPRPTGGDPNGNVRLSQWDIEDGSFFKLKNIRLSYRVPSRVLSTTHVFRGIVVAVQVQNVFTITKYTGFDPEVGMYNYKGVTNIAGMDEGRYPATRSFSFSLGLDF
ncbi:MAG TPA: TonB-dependent receptor [Puia sp.]|nr:TonB-dependent receptor [Puia sp.]